MALRPLIVVVGHVEWVRFLRLPSFPAEGEIVGAEGRFAQAAGGGGVVARVLAALGAEVHLLCALGRDRIGRRAYNELRGAGVAVHAGWRQDPTRRAVTLIGPTGERTIITVGRRLAPAGSDPLPWELCKEAAALYLTAADPAAYRHARSCSLLVASPRTGEALAAGTGGQPAADLLIYSGYDRGEQAAASALEGRVGVFVETLGKEGGRWFPGGAPTPLAPLTGSWQTAAPAAPLRDAYGAGDAFAAGVTYALAQGKDLAQATREGARVAAEVLACDGAAVPPQAAK